MPDLIDTRYFLVSYVYTIPESAQYGYGDLELIFEGGFPGRTWIKQEVARNSTFPLKTGTVVILNIMEFMDPEDFNDFHGEPIQSDALVSRIGPLH